MWTNLFRRGRTATAVVLAVVATMLQLLGGRAAAAAAATQSQASAGSPAYTVEDLGVFADGGNTSLATGINASGDVTGYANHASGAYTAFRWSNGTLTDLGDLGCGSHGNGINDSGTIVGYSNVTCGESDKAGFQTNGAGNTISDIGSLFAHPTIANAINASGQIVGSSITANGVGRAFISGPGGVGLQQVDKLVTSEPPGAQTLEGHGVNTAGDVVGIGFFSDQVCGGYDAPFLFSGGTLQNLATPGVCSGQANAVNDSQVVVGFEGGQPFLWDGTTHDLPLPSGLFLGNALAINNGGTVVGSAQASLYSYPQAWVAGPGGAITLLDGLVDPAAGWTFEVASGINDSGQIVGYGAHAGGIHAFRLTPAAPRTLTGVSVTPANPTVANGSTQQFTATGTYSDGSTADLTGTVTWTSSDPTVATVDASGLLTAVAPGTVTVTATSGSVSGATTATVPAPPVLTGISVTPANPTVPKGTTRQFLATGAYSDGSSADLTASVTWSSSKAAVATIDSSGLLSAVHPGTTTVTATSGSVSGSTTATVGAPAKLTAIAIAPTNPTVTEGLSLQFTATGTYSDGSSADLTASVHWLSVRARVATISATGLLQAVSSGTATVKAALSGVSATTTVTVNPRVLVSIVVSPANNTISAGATQQFTATGSYDNGTTANLTTKGIWTSSTRRTASIAPHTGLATAQKDGATTITFVDGSVTATAQLTVGSPGTF